MIAELLPFPGLKYDWADEILAALEAEGLRVVRLEQVGWIDYERDEDDRELHGRPGRFALIEHPGHDGARYESEPVFRIVSDPISPPQEG